MTHWKTCENCGIETADRYTVHTDFRGDHHEGPALYGEPERELCAVCMKALCHGIYDVDDLMDLTLRA